MVLINLILEISPSTAFNSDKKALKFPDLETIVNGFLHCEKRKIDT
jgi:hypothetical protein